jgi:hypothetical protein
MWTPCPTTIDAPVTILGLEPEDYSLVAMALIVASTCMHAILAFACAAGVGWAVWAAKRGRPPGAFIHALHRLELLPIRGVLRPHAVRYAPW